jgi:predicted phosphodiesterase
MLAALARQMDVDVLVSGGTHRYVQLASYCTGSG